MNSIDYDIRNTYRYIRCTRRIKAINNLLMCISLISAVIIIGITIWGFGHGYTMEDFEKISIRISYGDTAFDIASEYCPQDMDIRHYLDLCAMANGMQDMGNIYSGRCYVFLKLKN